MAEPDALAFHHILVSWSFEYLFIVTDYSNGLRASVEEINLSNVKRKNIAPIDMNF